MTFVKYFGVSLLADGKGVQFLAEEFFFIIAFIHIAKYLEQEEMTSKLKVSTSCRKNTKSSVNITKVLSAVVNMTISSVSH